MRVQVSIPSQRILDISNIRRLRRLLGRVPTYLRKRLYHREFAEDWVDQYGRLIVMGEAAYPIWVKSLVHSVLTCADMLSSHSAYRAVACQLKMLQC